MIELSARIKNGAIGILPTDTIYGIVGNALSPQVFEKICQLKKRKKDQKFVILISNWHHLVLLGVNLSGPQKDKLETFWPGPTTAVLDAPDANDNLSASDKTLAIRWPDKPQLKKLIDQTGPLIATSVNISGEPHLNSLREIKNQFPGLDFYIEGEVSSAPSQIIRIYPDGSEERLR